jgi:predicted transcriptional regulator
MKTFIYLWKQSLSRSKLIYNIVRVCGGEGDLMEYRALFRSELKQQILFSLLNGSKRLSDLKVDSDSTETTILHVLKEFEELELTTKSAGVYSLSPLGQIEAQICRQSYRATTVLEQFKEFWLTHNVKAIPPNLMVKIGELQEAMLMKTESSELGKVHEIFLKMMANTNKVVGISPVFHPDYVRPFSALLNQGGTIELILTGEVLSKTLESAVCSGDGELIEKFMTLGKLKIYLVDDLRIALTVTEEVFSMGLFDLNGQYDYGMDLQSAHPDALAWGREVFEVYLKQARKVEL